MSPATPIVLKPDSSPAAESTSERIHALDALRAVAMFLGIVLHAGIVYTVYVPLPGAGSDVSHHWGFDLGLAMIHGFRMQLFFLLAGFFGRLVHQRLGTRAFAEQRLRRIGIPFALAMVTIMPIVVLLAYWGFAREGKPAAMPPGITKGIPTMHLWFLLYLLYLYAVAIVALFLRDRFTIASSPRAKRLLDTAFTFPFRLFAFAPISALFLWQGPWWGEPVLGIFGLIPSPIGLAYYGTFFVAGWLLHSRPQQLLSLKNHIPLTVCLALIALSFSLTLSRFQFEPTTHPLFLKCLTLFCAAAYSWAMTFAMIGFFLRRFSDVGPWARYLADASYWCYLAHLPIVMVLHIFTAQLHWPALVKLILILGVTMAILLLVYEYRVRYTWVGKLLNGPRTRPTLPAR